MDEKRHRFLEMIDAHKGIIYKVTYAYCKDATDRQDLNQEIILQLWKSFDLYDEQFKLSTWIYRIALNTSISFYRKVTRYKQNRMSVSPILELKANEDDMPEEDHRIKLLYSFIQELNEFDRAIILLQLEGLSYTEIAEIVGTTNSNVGTKLSRIKKTIYQKFTNLK